MGRSYAQDPLSKMIDSDSESDSTPVGIYEIEETSQEMCTWPTSSSRHSPLSNGPGQSSRPADRSSLAFGHHNVSRGRDSDLSDLSSLFQRTTTNLFGRDLGEASSDLRRLLRPPQRSARNVTPSLTSDDTRTSSRTSSSFTSPQMSVPWELAPAQAPILPSTDKVAEPVITEAPKDAVVSISQRTRIEHTEMYDPSAQSVQKALSPVHVEDRSVEAPAPIPKLPPPPIGTDKGNSAYNWDFSSLSSTVLRIAVPTSSTQPPKAAGTARPTWMADSMAYHEEDEERDELLGDDEDDSYMPGPEDKPSRASPAKQRRKAAVGGFKCKHCMQLFTRNFDMLRHIKSVHESQTQDKILARTCPCCMEVLSRTDAFKRHIQKVPNSCNRAAKLQGKPVPPVQPEDLYKLCREGNPPLAGFFKPIA